MQAIPFGPRLAVLHPETLCLKVHQRVRRLQQDVCIGVRFETGLRRGTVR